MSKNNWHKSMYDMKFASRTIGSKERTQKAKQEARFLVEELDQPPGSQWLDVACGTGRHSLLFAKANYQVTGIDISKDCLKIAKKTPHSNLQYLHGDMSKLSKFQNQFDIVTNLFTSFGYFATEKENERVLKGMIACLKPGGIFALNAINRDYLMSIYQPARWSEDRNIMTIEASRFDPKTKYNETQLVLLDKKTGQGQNYYHRIRLYSKSEMVALFKKVGLRRIRVFGDFYGRKFDKLKSTHPIYIGER